MTDKKTLWQYHVLLIPGVVLLFIFNVIPMGGIIMAFQDFMPARGIFRSEFVGLRHFRTMLMFPDIRQVFINTLIIAISKIILSLLAAVGFAILLNEVKFLLYKRFVQTIVYMPHFISWVILAVMFNNVFSYTGIVNQIVEFFGGEPQLWLVSNTWFRPIIILTDVWKGFGFGAIIYIAAISNIDPNMFEAASIDGAGRMRKIWHITLPTIKPTVILVSTLALGGILSAGFEQIFTMISPLVYETGDIIDTYVFRMGLIRMQFSFGTAVGLLRSVVALTLIVLSYKLAKKFAGYTIF